MKLTGRRGGRASEKAGARDMAMDATPKSFWSYQSSEPTPSLEEVIKAGAISANTTQAQWESLSPGMRREIARSVKKSKDEYRDEAFEAEELARGKQEDERHGRWGSRASDKVGARDVSLTQDLTPEQIKRVQQAIQETKRLLDRESAYAPQHQKQDRIEEYTRHLAKLNQMLGKDDLATDPPVSEAQRKAMWAAKSGHSTLGIPQKVGAEFAKADPGGKLP